MRKSASECFARWFKDDPDAIDLAAGLWEAMQIWDDVIDEGDTSRANEVFAYLVFRMPLHPFMVKFGHMIQPALLGMYLDWRDATEMEKSGDEADLEKSFILRAGIYRVYSVMAWIIGGEAHSMIMGPEIHRQYAERLDDYKKEKAHA